MASTTLISAASSLRSSEPSAHSSGFTRRRSRTTATGRPSSKPVSPSSAEAVEKNATRHYGHPAPLFSTFDHLLQRSAEAAVLAASGGSGSVRRSTEWRAATRRRRLDDVLPDAKPSGSLPSSAPGRRAEVRDEILFSRARSRDTSCTTRRTARP